MLLDFRFNNRYLSEFGCAILEPPIRSFPIKDIEAVEVPGRSGNLIIDKGRYKNITIKYKVATIPTMMCEQLEDKLREIKAWILSGTYGKLIDENFGSGYYIAYCSNISDPTTSFDGIAEFYITFSCKPLFYLNVGLQTISKEKPADTDNFHFKIFNLGTYEALPKIRIYGSGAITILINNLSCKIIGVEEYVDIDSELHECFKGTKNEIENFSGHFPTIPIGENTIFIDGEATKIEIIPRWCVL